VFIGAAESSILGHMAAGRSAASAGIEEDGYVRQVIQPSLGEVLVHSAGQRCELRDGDVVLQPLNGRAEALQGRVLAASDTVDVDLSLAFSFGKHLLLLDRAIHTRPWYCRATMDDGFLTMPVCLAVLIQMRSVGFLGSLRWPSTRSPLSLFQKVSKSSSAGARGLSSVDIAAMAGVDTVAAWECEKGAVGTVMFSRCRLSKCTFPSSRETL
jgi:hypothetical protein